MMRCLFLLLIFFLASCNENKKRVDSFQSSNDYPKNVMPIYDSMKMRINNYKKNFIKSGADIPENYFVSIIVDSIIPYWYGTKWDFNGSTQTPRKGKIACGYFVTTILRDAGVPLNRVKLAQAPSSKLIKTLSAPNMIQIFSNTSLENSLAYVKKQGAGLFIVGLDNHVGFLYNDNNQIWFIHAKWAYPDEVVKEDAARSSILFDSKYRMIGKISNNKTLLQKWIYNSYCN